ncbi:methyltransferase domain-containing protein [Paenibacillus enshidis]|uniref:Methyltransferase domain-containing protein n=1 Tax=Paenibacillus enshidis TaxID=1458439 RepID=A0ABV5AU36_9BACL
MSTKITKEKDFHNQVFDGDNTAREIANEKFYSITESLINFYREKLLASHKDKQVLEYGCGLSAYSYFLAREGAAFVRGIDISDVAVEKANAKAEQEGLAHKMEFLVMDAEKLEFPDNTFDLICGNGILHHLDLHKSYRELARTIKPDGKAIFTEPLGHNPLINWYRNRTPNIRTEDEHPLMMDDIQLASQYFGKVETRYFFLATLALSPFRKARFFRNMVSACDAIDRVLFKALPFLRKHAWMVVMTMSEPKKK